MSMGRLISLVVPVYWRSGTYSAKKKSSDKTWFSEWKVCEVHDWQRGGEFCDMKMEREGDKGIVRIVSRHWKIAWRSAMKVDIKLLRGCAKRLTFIESAKETRFLISKPFMKGYDLWARQMRISRQYFALPRHLMRNQAKTNVARQKNESKSENHCMRKLT